jgi:hypothetical protein
MELTKALTADALEHIVAEEMRHLIDADYVPAEIEQSAKLILAWYTPFTPEKD